MKRLGPLLLAAACGSSSPKMPDAHVPDASADSQIDATPDAPTVPTGSHRHFVVNQLRWPTSSVESREDAFDLDGNGVLDNQIGAVIVALRSQGGIDAQPPSDAAIARGVSITLADLQTPDSTTASAAGFTLYAGTNPNPAPCNGSADSTCGRHLTGNGSFDVATSPRDMPIVGPIASGVYSGGPGHLDMPVYIASGTPAFVTLLGAHAQFTVSANGLVQGKIGGAVPITDLDTKLYPAMATGYTAMVAHDCSALQNPPGCGCLQGSQGAALIAFFDATHDCAITVPELEENSLLMSLFQPDVLVEGQTGLSFGCAFTAVDATFTP